MKGVCEQRLMSYVRRRFLTSHAMQAGVPLPPMTTWTPASVQEGD
jgi:hypothetical protein